MEILNFKSTTFVSKYGLFFSERKLFILFGYRRIIIGF